MKAFLYLISIIFIASTVFSQTPQQLERLKTLNKEQRAVDEKIVQKAEQNTSGLPEKIFIYADDFQIFTTVTGSKLCSFNIFAANGLKAKIKELKILFTWGETSAPLTFSGVGVFERQQGDLAFGGSVCDSVTSMPSMKINVCSVEGMTTPRCQAAVEWAINEP